MNPPSPCFLSHVWVVPLFPLATAAAMLFFGRRLGKQLTGWLCSGSVGFSFFYSVGAFLQLLALPPGRREAVHVLFDWVPVVAYHTTAGTLANFTATWGFEIDPLSTVMILVVTGVGLLIHIYSVGYMREEDGYSRFFGCMNLFIFAMLILVLADNLLVFYAGWEGVGLCSYLLIGFYFRKPAASDAGKKAFIVNRVGDAFFLVGLFLASGLFGSIRFADMGPALAQGRFVAGDPRITAIALLFFAGATAKSAQIPLYIWLPDAMEGPTPVSALIHAATMVTAGVYFVARVHAVYELSPLAMTVVGVIGAVTAIFAATMAIVENDIKKVLAYSTISQLGYMFLACGVGAFAAGIFHLMTHAFFKGLLFLAAGSVIHALSGEQDMRRMGGLRKKIPFTYWTMLIAALALAGIFPFAGFLSKDLILTRAHEHGEFLWALGLLTAGVTAFYIFRLIFMTFHGEPRESMRTESHIHRAPVSMLVPLGVLAALSLAGGWVSWPEILGGGSRFVHFLAPVTGTAREAERLTSRYPSPRSAEIGWMLASQAVAGLGIFFAWYLYVLRRDLLEKIAQQCSIAFRLLRHRYYVDEMYNAVFVQPVKALSTALGRFDGMVIDGAGVDGAGWLVRTSSRISMWWDDWIVDGMLRLAAGVVRFLSIPARLVQNGLVQSYLLVFVIGLIGFLGYYAYLAHHTGR